MGKPASAAVALALAFVLLHLPFLPSSLEDLDSVNFALGLRDFDVAEHQPHPPGYPVFVFVATGMRLLTGSEVRALSLTSLLAGGAGVMALVALFAVMNGRRRAATLTATTLAAGAPLYWLAASRPLSDMTGLAAALGAQAAVLSVRTPRALAWAAAAAGLAAGVRSQVVWLTLPLVALVAVMLDTPGRARLVATTGAAYLAGVLAWGVPLIAVTGGPGAYWDALTAQGAEDFANVPMLLTSFTPRLALSALRDTFVAPWASGWLAAPVLVAAAAGVLMAILRDRRTLALLGVSFGPYLLFHLLVQETFTTRYALPLVVPVAWFAVRGLAALGRGGLAVAAALVVAGSVVGQSAVIAYGRAEAPAFRLLTDMRTARSSGDAPPVLAMHRRGAFDFRRPLRWVGDAMPPFAGRLESPPKHEWLELVRYWNSGGRSPVWFITDPLRADLALIDHDGPAASYRWPFPAALVGGARPDAVDWYVFDRPAWYLGEGWALTPETAGVAAEDGRGPGIAPIEGWIRRSSRPLRIMIGGRNLAGRGPSVHVSVTVDGAVLDEWVQEPGFFLRWLQVDTLAGPGDYAPIGIAASLPALAIEQFDAQVQGDVIHGYGQGWHELELNPALGRLWRWTSDRALIDVRAGDEDLLLNLSGETDPSADQPRLVVRLNGDVLLDTRVDGPFAFTIPMAAGALREGAGLIAIETDQIRVPAERSRRSSDRRRLGLRIDEVSVRPAS